MKNTFKILWSKRAYNSLSNVISFLEDNWTEKEIKKFSQKLDHCINIIEKNPETFPLSDYKPGLRKVVVTRQNTLYYKIDGNIVTLVNIFDTRQNPGKI